MFLGKKIPEPWKSQDLELGPLETYSAPAPQQVLGGGGAAGGGGTGRLSPELGEGPRYQSENVQTRELGLSCPLGQFGDFSSPVAARAPYLDLR